MVDEGGMLIFSLELVLVGVSLLALRYSLHAQMVGDGLVSGDSRQGAQVVSSAHVAASTGSPSCTTSGLAPLLTTDANETVTK